MKNRGVLTAHQKAFVRHNLADSSLNATQAALKAGYSHRTAGIIAHQLLKIPLIAATIEKAMLERAERTKISADLILKGLYAIATADRANTHDQEGVIKLIHDIPHELRIALDGLDGFESVISG